MLSILPAFSSPDLKVFLLPKKSFKSSAGGQTGPLRVPAARLCDLFRSASAPLHKSHRLAYTRIGVVALVILSVGLCLSRKDRYLPLQPLCVRLLPRPTGLPAHGFRSNLPSAYADVKSLLPPSSEDGDSRFRGCGCLSIITRPRLSLVVYLWFSDGPFQVLLCYLCG